MEQARQFVSAVLAGFMIGMGATAFLSLENKVLGACMFGVGLFTVVVFQLQLFTGKIGYLPFQKKQYLIELIITWMGNFFGTFLIAKCVQNTRIFTQDMVEKVASMTETKLNDHFFSIFILSVFCGILMFIAVDTFREQQGAAIKVIAIFIPVMVFILSGFEHVVANMYYFSMAQKWSFHTVVLLIIMTLGNSIGAMLLPLYQKGFHIK